MAWRRCSNCIFIMNVTSGFNGRTKGNCKTRQERFRIWDWVQLILELVRYLHPLYSVTCLIFATRIDLWTPDELELYHKAVIYNKEGLLPVEYTKHIFSDTLITILVSLCPRKKSIHNRRSLCSSLRALMIISKDGNYCYRHNRAVCLVDNIDYIGIWILASLTINNLTMLTVMTGDLITLKTLCVYRT